MDMLLAFSIAGLGVGVVAFLIGLAVNFFWYPGTAKDIFAFGSISLACGAALLTLWGTIMVVMAADKFGPEWIWMLTDR